MSTSNVSKKLLVSDLDEENFEEYIYVAFKYLLPNSLTPREVFSSFFDALSSFIDIKTLEKVHTSRSNCFRYNSRGKLGVNFQPQIFNELPGFYSKWKKLPFKIRLVDQ